MMELSLIYSAHSYEAEWGLTDGWPSALETGACIIPAFLFSSW